MNCLSRCLLIDNKGKCHWLAGWLVSKLLLLGLTVVDNKGKCHWLAGWLVSKLLLLGLTVVDNKGKCHQPASLYSPIKPSD